ncbi:hypothetical protein [Ideonella sp. BN130291]|nr:hypothetical protein [Ideonella sp. BN130291]
MSKDHQRGNKEARKPKQPRPAPMPAASNPVPAGPTVPGGKKALDAKDRS